MIGTDNSVWVVEVLGKKVSKLQQQTNNKKNYY